MIVCNDFLAIKCCLIPEVVVYISRMCKIMLSVVYSSGVRNLALVLSRGAVLGMFVCSNYSYNILYV